MIKAAGVLPDAPLKYSDSRSVWRVLPSQAVAELFVFLYPAASRRVRLVAYLVAESLVKAERFRRLL